VFAALGYQVFVQQSFSESLLLFKNNLTWATLPFFILVILLMPINLGTEAYKWKVLLLKTHNLSFFESLRGVFAGISFSIFTPKRIGEYAGRLLLVGKKKMSAAGSLFVGNFAQTIANLMIGLIATLLFFKKFTVQLDEATWLIPLSIFLIMLLFVAYFSIEKIHRFFSRVSRIEHIVSKVNVISTYPKQTLFSLFSLSILKYTVYIIQFVLLLFAFGIELRFFDALLAAACVFFVKTMLPLPASVELAARGSIAIFFFGYLTQNHIGILVASIVLWVVNLGLPAVLGSYFITKKRI